MKKNQTKKKNENVCRPPVVVVLGHIDHGKTTLLDFIRQTRIAAKEAGGITQSIGAYQVETATSDKQQAIRKVTFIDTPGHEAFAKMRARGARVADIAVLVVAANDGVMPQTKEAIAHIKVAAIPVVVAINKIDLKEANPAKVMGQLVKEGIVPEEKGGDVPTVPISAKTGEGVPALLEMICLVADMLELKSELEAPLDAPVIESTLSPRQGPTATVVVRSGVLRVGEEIVADGVGGKVKALISDQGERLREALPGAPVMVLGLSGVAPVGATVTKGLGKADQAARHPSIPVLKPSATLAADLNVILRADTQGSLEAISGTLSELEEGGRKVSLLLAGLGQVTDSDIYLARSAGGVVLGFNVGGSASVKKLADDLGVGLRFFTIIYELLEMTENLLKGMSELEKAKVKGGGEVIKTFDLHSGDVVAGVHVTAGRIKYRDKVKVMRGEEEISQGQVRGLRIKDKNVPEAKEGDEVGLLIKPQVDFKSGDKVVVI